MAGPCRKFLECMNAMNDRGFVWKMLGTTHNRMAMESHTIPAWWKHRSSVCPCATGPTWKTQHRMNCCTEKEGYIHTYIYIYMYNVYTLGLCVCLRILAGFATLAKNDTVGSTRMCCSSQASHQGGQERRWMPRSYQDPWSHSGTRRTKPFPGSHWVPFPDIKRSGM